MDLHISSTDRAGFVVVQVGGEIDVATSPQLVRYLRHTLLRRSPRVVLDLSQVTFMDANGIRLLIRARRHAELVDGDLYLADASPPVRRVLELTGVDTVFRAAPPAARPDPALTPAGHRSGPG